MAHPGLVLVSVADDLVGATRKLLDPRLPATAARHRPNCTCGFEWGTTGPSTSQLGAAILADHFEHNPCDLPAAKKIMKCPNDPGFMDAAMVIGPKFATDVLATIPSASEWSVTTSMICEYLSFLSGSAAAKPAPFLGSLEPGYGHDVPHEADPDATSLAIFVQAVRAGNVVPLPAVVAEKLISTFIDCIRDAIRSKRTLAPILGAQVGPVEVQLHLFAQPERVLLERMLGPSRVRAALKTAEESFGTDTLRGVFGEWVSPE